MTSRSVSREEAAGPTPLLTHRNKLRIAAWNVRTMYETEIGADNKGYEEIMGTHGIGQMNENGERFADLCALNQMVIGGSIFPHKNIHKMAWRSPDHTTETKLTIFVL
ncbi:hypothetical protein ElyMa_003088000 [Elysia marginata]|uniref:Endonuclease/exonuclease/phosphatase domain-containing protein n=1 Tax=Elysia marginata TaxID=1093978 RepID=A0AAV4IP43_9GAST|nr:hypothetical protein ElyMa_003088000 [Elysia marginata]